MIIAKGWLFYSADFSRQCEDPCNMGSVMLIRCIEERKKWHRLPDKSYEHIPLYVSGKGFTLESALINANIVAGHYPPIEDAG
jgi:hypothetical protein